MQLSLHTLNKKSCCFIQAGGKPSGQTHYNRFYIEKWRKGVKRLAKTLVLCCRESGKRIQLQAQNACSMLACDFGKTFSRLEAIFSREYIIMRLPQESLFCLLTRKAFRVTNFISEARSPLKSKLQEVSLDLNKEFTRGISRPLCAKLNKAGLELAFFLWRKYGKLENL